MVASLAVVVIGDGRVLATMTTLYEEEAMMKGSALTSGQGCGSHYVGRLW